MFIPLKMVLIGIDPYPNGFDTLAHDGSMVLVYMLTYRGYIDGIHVTIYSSTMDSIGTIG